MSYKQSKKQSQNPLFLKPVKPSNICQLFVLNETASSRKWTSLRGIKTGIKNEKEGSDSENKEIREEKIPW